MPTSTLAPAQPYPPEAWEAARSAFLQANPSYAATARLRDLRATEYARLDRLGHVYLDYTGGSLYAESQVHRHWELLQENVFGNPHSVNPTSMAATRLVDAARAYVYDFFRASPDEYTVIFTPNASGALKLVGEAYPFAPGGHYLLTFDNHNSVNGIREFAQAKGAEVLYLPVVPPDLRISQERLDDFLGRAEPGQANLFAFPAQSNFSGVQHPLELIEQAKAAGWDVLLDAAAFTPTNRLDLSIWKPDFVSLSFYKIFGYPTGVGCLLARKDALKKLRRPWFAGGTITIASVQGCGHFLADSEAAFEDGTVDYLNLPAIHIGLEYIDSIGVELIHERVAGLTGWLLAELISLRHSNGAPLVRIYGPTDTESRRDYRLQLLRSRRPSGGLSQSGAARQQLQHLPAHRLLLQPRRGGAGPRPDRGRDGRGFPERGAHDPGPVSGDCTEQTQKECGCGAGLSGHRQQLRRCLPFSGFRGGLFGQACAIRNGN